MSLPYFILYAIIMRDKEARYMLKTFDIMPGIRGELEDRLILNLSRLNSKHYRPENIFTADKAGWPGDWEGRTLLADVRLWDATGIKPAYLDNILPAISERLAEKGYLGHTNEPGTADEQQLSGHNWLLRGILEYYVKTGSVEFKNLADRMVESLYLPLKGMYKDYPLDPEERGTAGEYAGTVTGALGSWTTSSDIGCAFMCLDALSQYYALFKRSDVLELLGEMIEKFRTIDFVGSHMQTHATLSATRGILRLYEATENRKYLTLAKKIFTLYEKYGMTENYANFNWFGRNDTWTEPCAIVDSMMCAQNLFRFTEDIRYAHLFRRIYFNALSYAQRPNGGFGLDVCTGPASEYLRPNSKGICEAFWCCTMRGAEGLHSVAKNLFCYDENGNILVNLISDASVETKDFALSVKLSDDSVRLSFMAFSDYSGKIFLIGDNCEPLSVDISVKKGSSVSTDINLGFREISEEKANLKGKKKFFIGDRLLGLKEGAEELSPLGDMYDLEPEEINAESRKILF